MNEVAVLVGLLALAYFGSILFGGRAIRGYGLPSGSEYLMLGFILGPHVLGVLERSTLTLFDPLAHVALSWLGLLIGLDYAIVGERRVGARAMFASLAFVIFCGSLVAAGTWYVARLLTPLTGRELLLLAGGMGAIGGETTRHAVRWVVERYGAVGPLSGLVASIADADDLVPLLLIAVLFATTPLAGTAALGSAWIWLGATLGVGLLLGLACAALLGDQLHSGEALTFVFGAALLGTGVATQLGLSGLATTFALGTMVSLVSRHRSQLRSMLETTERPVLLPVFLLAGAHVRLEATPLLGGLVAVAICARVIGKLLCGWVLGAALPPARRAGALLGLGLLSSGSLTISIGFSFALRYPERIGPLVLVVAVALTLFGELIGPTALRRALLRAGELKTTASRTLITMRTGTGT